MPFLLDTNACIDLINGRNHVVRDHLDGELAAGHAIHVSSIAAFELWYGVGKSTHRERNSERLRAFFKGPLTVLDFDSEDAETAGLIRAALESKGRPIGPFDLLIAAQALRRQATLVTANHAEFSRIKELDWVDWTKARR
ncbi:type II toxin-antitoxin system VapC family toxin [Dongia sp.]|uniref:type II toxin-antitoxin system VapC family toxin n=1 Tax=Dongia sp. TaxID=1977262 RepID=UPI0037539677